jgi:hypothetical protein
LHLTFFRFLSDGNNKKQPTENNNKHQRTYDKFNYYLATPNFTLELNTLR